METVDSHIQKECPFCLEPVAARGLHTHVRNSDDDVHGPGGSVPDDFDASAVAIASRSGNVFRAGSEPDRDKKELYLCHCCGEFCKGKRGFGIHLSKQAGNFQHPDDVDVESAEYTRVPCNDEWEPYVDKEDILERRFSFVDESLTIGIPNLEQRERETPAVDVPDADNKTEQVAILLDEHSEFYQDPGAVTELLNCSRTTFYEGRQLYDNVKDTKEGRALF